MNESKAYYAVIPANIRYDKDLTANSKLLYGEITALCNEKGYCWATNNYFAELYGVGKNTISNWIGQLIKKGYLFSEIKYKFGTNEIDKRYLKLTEKPILKSNDTYNEKMEYPISKNNDTYNEKMNDPTPKNQNAPITKNWKENNTILNNTINNTLDNNTISKDIVCRTKVQPIIDKWNELGLQKIIAITPGTNRYTLLNARIKSYGLDNILRAIENIAGSKFLKGQNKNGWIITFDWLIKPNNFIKVLEGNYNNEKVVNLNDHVNSVKNQSEKQKLRFNNFESRDYYNNPKEMDQLEKKLLGWDDEN